VSRLHLVDLAGSERIGKTGIEGQIKTEAININLALHHLERVIVTLQQKSEG
jgi:kinesin family protein 6/9